MARVPSWSTVPRRPPAVDGDELAGQERGLVAGQIDGGMADVVRSADAPDGPPSAGQGNRRSWPRMSGAISRSPWSLPDNLLQVAAELPTPCAKSTAGPMSPLSKEAGMGWDSVAKRVTTGPAPVDGAAAFSARVVDSSSSCMVEKYLPRYSLSCQQARRGVTVELRSGTFLRGCGVVSPRYRHARQSLRTAVEMGRNG